MSIFSSDATTLIVRADAHSGHKLGLQNPATELWEEDEEGNPAPYIPELTATQDFLWEAYSRHVPEAINGAGKDDIVLLDLGDACQGSKYASELVSIRDADQIELALGTFEPFEPYANRIKFIRLLVGTGAHNFGFGSAGILLVGRLRNMFPKSDVKLVKHGLFTVGGVPIDAAHHGPGGGIRSWLRGNIVRRYLQSIMIDELMAGNRPPMLVLRAHHHVELHEVVSIMSKDGKLWRSSIHLVPPYSGVTHYARRVAQSVSTLRVGLLSFRLKDGVAEGPRRMVKTIDLRTKEVLL